MRQSKSYWNRENCFNEAKKYKTITDFENGSKGACAAARAHGWMKDYTWFTILWQEKWNRETYFQEAQKYTTIFEFQKKSSSAYHGSSKRRLSKRVYMAEAV